MKQPTKRPVRTIAMTRTEFEEEFGFAPHGEAVGMTLHGPDRTAEGLRIKFVGHRQYEVQELEKLFKLKGEA